ncbi:hypothetical protein M970_041270 [Encephalitozoon cuniculi EcunIII-L]|uniref:Uncharacterized protein n=1 Tax=Encephalitozoon cuniculi TaxID=6035 RepID=M1KJ80_ENCCN|nr:hypothetical protein ECU04_1320 [Encephalitozoon cuniculi]KMV66335.1 hypothetical protein M970_041270 [Encephalitozoon cuniculi EcunIII-L]UYI27514.1 hypothetical protein J0A71_06g13850 [Encephalitozoon cuniculi]
MNLISASNGSVIFCKGKALVVKNTTTDAVEEVAVPGQISFMCKRYLVDSEKNLYTIDGSALRKILKLSRNIFCLVEHGDAVYVADRFGDVHRIGNGECEYVLGTLSYLTGMAIHNGKIILSDKYGRIRISRMDGKILDYKFSCDPIVSLECINGSLVSISNRCVALHDREYSIKSAFELPEDTKVLKTISRGKDELIVICPNSYLLFRVEDRIDLVSLVKEAIADGVCSGSTFYKVMLDLTIVDDSGKVFYE